MFLPTYLSELINRFQKGYGLFLLLLSIAICGWPSSYSHAGSTRVSGSGIEKPQDKLKCLTGLFSGNPGRLKSHEINLGFSGRITVGDLNADGNPDFVVTNRNKISAYDLCGQQLWQLQADTNWDHTSHVYWNWTSYGYIGDADGDGKSEFLHIGADWQTLYIREGKTGLVKHVIDLASNQKWMYVLLGRRSDEPEDMSTRIFVTGSPANNTIKAIDIRAEAPKTEWTYAQPRLQNAYMPPLVADIDGAPGDELLHATTAVSENGKQIWRHDFSRFSIIGAAHTLTVKDIDSEKPGLEAVFSVYGPKNNSPSLISYANHKPNSINWRAFSPNMTRHAHQHTVGDFDISKAGLETLARNNDGINHWLVDSKGQHISDGFRLAYEKLPGNWNSGELVQGIEWDEYPGTEILYTERHVGFREIPRLVVTSSSRPIDMKTRLFHGGIDVPRSDDDPKLADKPDPSFQSWFGYVNRESSYDNDGPYEGAAHAIDLFGDGREEILTWGAKKIMIYYNSGNAGVKKRWGNPGYMKLKKLWCNVYNPR